MALTCLFPPQVAGQIHRRYARNPENPKLVISDDLEQLLADAKSAMGVQEVLAAVGHESRQGLSERGIMAWLESLRHSGDWRGMLESLGFGPCVSEEEDRGAHSDIATIESKDQRGVVVTVHSDGGCAVCCRA